ncbi:MAG: DUF4955 domain-containing protein [Cyclobacteriaceae bacterium]
MRKFKYIPIVIFLTTTLSAAAQTPDIWQNYLDAQSSDTQSELLDFSYAGYKFSEESIPDISNWTKFDVTSYGAIANDDDYDDAGIQAAIIAAEASSAPAVVFFPPGRFKVSSDNDAAKFLKIVRSNIVLKGSGSGEGGTEIFMDKYRAVNGHWQFHLAPETTNTDNLTVITEAVTKGDFNVTVEDPSTLSVGQTIHISHKSEAFARAHFGELELSNDWSRLFGASGGMSVYEPHIVKSISGNRVTFENPVQTDLPLLSAPYSIKNLGTIEDVGVEDILFTSNWENYGETFSHHKDDIHDYGWSAVQFEYVKNGWMRNCEFRGWSEVVDVRQSIGVTIENIKISGEMGHASFLTRRSYGVLVKDCVDESGQFHGPGTGYSGVNTVYLRCTMQEDQSVDSHSGQPYATLLDDVQGGVFDRNGGPHESYPHHARDLVFWNFRHQSSGDKSYDFWSVNNRTGNTYAEPFFIGFQSNNSVTFKGEGLNQMPSTMVEPRSLFEAQLSLRLSNIATMPQVSFLSPEAGVNLEKESSLTVEVDVSDPDGTVAFVDLTLGDVALRRIESAPFKWGVSSSEDPLLFNLAAGDYELTAIVTDNDNNSSEAEITFTVGQAPTISFIRPATTKIIEQGDHVEVEVSAEDSDGTVSRIDLYMNDQLVGTKTTSPFIWGTSETEHPALYNLAAGDYKLEAIAFDDDDLSALAVSSFVANRPPSISFSTPENGVTYEEGANVKVNIGASDVDGSITEVKLYLNQEFIRADNSLPYTWGFDQSKDPELFNMQGGQYWIRGEARDNRNSTVSDSIMVIVEGPVLQSSRNLPVAVYPNPFIEHIVITHNDGGLQNLRLVNIQGKEIAITTTIENLKTTIYPAKTLASGLYLLHYASGSESHSIKILKQ